MKTTASPLFYIVPLLVSVFDGALEAHFGLGKHDKVDVRVTLPGGKTTTFTGVKADRFIDFNPLTGQHSLVEASP